MATGYIEIMLLTLILQTTQTKTETDSKNPRIVGGFKVSIEEVPYQVSLRYHGNGFCGGTLIKLDYVLTAAHCMFYEINHLIPLSVLKVCAGTSHSKRCPFSRDIYKSFIHDYYSSYTSSNDIALLQLMLPFNKSYSIQTVPVTYLTPKEETICIVSGWGRLKYNGTSPDDLMAVYVPIFNQHVCQFRMALFNFHVSYFMICAGFEDGGKGVCQGDSGGPLVCNGALAGVVSIGVGCAYPKLPAIYTNVALYNMWLRMRMDSSTARSSLKQTQHYSFNAFYCIFSIILCFIHNFSSIIRN